MIHLLANYEEKNIPFRIQTSFYIQIAFQNSDRVLVLINYTPLGKDYGLSTRLIATTETSIKDLIFSVNDAIIEIESKLKTLG